MGRDQARSVLTPFRLWLIGLVIATPLAAIVAVSIGSVPVPFRQVVQILGFHLFPGMIEPTWPPAADRIVWVFRLPRVLLAVIVGTALSVSGTTLQAIARNPLADPFVFGVSYGATVGAVWVLTLGARPFGDVSLTIAAFLGALVAMVVVYLFAQQRGRVSPLRLILAGVALSYTLSAITSYLVLRASQQANNQAGLVLSWLAGSFGRARWEHLGLPALIAIVVTIYLIFQARQLDILLVGDERAIGLGVNIEQFRIQIFVATSLMVGAVVAVSGAIGFVGLMVPHLVRLGVGSAHRQVLPLAALGGGLLMVVVDSIGRTIVAPEELPVGIVTAALGGPFFLWLLRRSEGNTIV